MGVINVGGSGSVVLNGKEYKLNKYEGLYSYTCWSIGCNCIDNTFCNYVL